MSMRSPLPPASAEEAALDRILDGLLQLMRGKFDHRLPVSSSDNVVDAIHVAINMTADELQHLDAERRGAMERLEHLNRVLRAIRDVNQLIVNERRADQLLARACQLIVDSGSYTRAWLVINDEGGTAAGHVAEAGWGAAFAPMAEQLRRGAESCCATRCRSTGAVVTIRAPHRECADCPLRDSYGDQLALTARLEHAGKVMGTLVVTAGHSDRGDDEEQALLAELASDLAYALHNIRVEQERAAAVEELRRSHELLRNTSAQLVQAAKLSAMGELAASVAHELNQPLNVIRLVAQYHLRYASGESSEQRDDLEEISNQVGVMAEIIEHMILFARPTTGLVLKPVDLSHVVRQALRVVTAQLSAHSITLDIELDEELPLVRGNTTKLGQVILNLLSNARQALSTLERSDKRIEVRTFLHTPPDHGRSMVVLEMRDNGCGMSEAVLQRIFEPFFTTKEVGRGPGLGLSVARAIVEDHDGRIDAQSEPDQGTVLRVELPAMADCEGPPRRTGDHRTSDPPTTVGTGHADE